MFGQPRERGVLQDPVQSTFGGRAGPAAFAGHAVQVQSFDPNEVVLTHELGAEFVREIVPDPRLPRGQVGGGGLVRLIAATVPVTASLTCRDHPGFGHPTLMKLAVFVQTSGVGGIVETAAVISGGVHHTPINTEHPTRTDLASDG